jgi:hypothetical protein
MEHKYKFGTMLIIYPKSATCTLKKSIVPMQLKTKTNERQTVSLRKIGKKSAAE